MGKVASCLLASQACLFLQTKLVLPLDKLCNTLRQIKSVKQ
jgi:hypothetical protein